MCGFCHKSRAAVFCATVFLELAGGVPIQPRGRGRRDLEASPRGTAYHAGTRSCAEAGVEAGDARPSGVAAVPSASFRPCLAEAKSQRLESCGFGFPTA